MTTIATDANTADARRRQVRTTLLPAVDLRPFVENSFVDPLGSTTLPIIEPATEDLLVNMPVAEKRDVERAVTAARKAFDEGPWPRLQPRERAAALLRLADVIERNAERLVLMEGSDAGKTVSSVRSWGVPFAVSVYRYYASLADTTHGGVVATYGDKVISTQKEPVGVCAAILPWNFPFTCAAWKLAPALAAGCTVVVKSSERAPLSTQILAELIREADFPPGVVNVVMGEGSVASAALVADPRIDMVSFTGSTATGAVIARATSGRCTRLALELGGKSPNVVFADADLDRAVLGSIDAMFQAQGQNCCAGSRTFVHRDIMEAFTARLAAVVAERRVGDPLRDDTEQGPQIDRAHLERIDGYVQEALNAGAHAVTGGGVAQQGGLYYSPTLISGAAFDSRIAREEVFGPVGCVFPFTTMDEVVALSNDTDYGLSASVWTTNENTATQFANACRVGTIWINCWGEFDVAAPWGGVKRSGIGRELGRAGLDEFLETKTVFRY